MFDHVIAAAVHGSGYERIASPECSDRTIRRQLLRLTLSACDQMIGLNLDDLSADGSITKSPCGG